MRSSKFRLILVAQIMCMIIANANTVIMPAKCTNHSFCFELDNNYPHKEIEAVMGKYIVNITNVPNTLQIRNADVGDDENQPCKSRSRRGHIYYIRDEKNNVRYVVQSVNSTPFMQEFTVKQCRGTRPNTPLIFNDEEICRRNVSCVEKLVPVHFLVLTDDKRDVEMATIKDGLPMACSCEYSSTLRPKYECNDNFYD